MRSFIAAVAYAACFSNVLGSPVEDRAAGPSATIKDGTVIGLTTTFPGASAAATKYLSIPFAQSPPLRFAPPQPPTPWTKPYMAVNAKDACLQQFSDNANPNVTKEIFNNPGGPPPTESEDCLYLDVFVPPGTKASDKKPVMFWIYGGNLAFGTKNLMFYDGTSFATNQDVIVVVPNYRTNVFGFSNSPQIPTAQQNAGLLDQRMALKWTHDNIAAFGGDASRVTIFGESAGGYSVRQLLAFPPSPPQFYASIQESTGASRLGDGGQSWQSLVNGMNCSGAANALKCVRGKKGTVIKRYIEEQGLAFPAVLNDITAASDETGRLSAGKFAKVPYLVGTNADEGRAFTHLAGLDSPGANLTQFLASQFGPAAPAIEKLLKKVVDPALQTPYLLGSYALTLALFQCPMKSFAETAQAHDYAVHRYLFNGTFPNVSIWKNAGAFHSVEIPEVFGTYPRENVLGKATANQIALSKYMQTAWANFAKKPASGPGWKPYGPTGNIEVLGYPKRGTGNPIKSAQVDQLCNLLGNA